MSSEQNLNAPDFKGNVASALGAAAMAKSGRGRPKWLRYLMGFFAIITALVVGAGVIDKTLNLNSLPACDGKRTRDTLSDLNKANQVNASAYNFIKQVSVSDSEIKCLANLALRSGGVLEYDYRVFKDSGTIRVEITQMRR